MAARTVSDLDVSGRKVLVRVDFNVPIKNGTITDDTRIRASLPTIQQLLDRGATVILASHLGRPKGKPNPEFSLEPIAARLSQLLGGRPVQFAADSVGEQAQAAIEAAGKGGVVLLENLRFHAEEEKNDPAFARQLAALADVYVNDAFGSAHRAHASTEGIVHHVQEAAAGLLMGKEVEYLAGCSKARSGPSSPCSAAPRFGQDRSDREPDRQGRHAADRRRDGLHVPQGAGRRGRQVAGRGRSPRHGARRRAPGEGAGPPARAAADHVVAAKLEAGVPTEVLEATDPSIGDRMGLDIGPKTIDVYRSVIAGAKTVIWNGPMGVFEIDAFAKGTIAVAKAVAAVKGTTVIGGGDSIAAVARPASPTDHAHLDGRRSVARVPWRPNAAGSGRAAVDTCNVLRATVLRANVPRARAACPCHVLGASDVHVARARRSTFSTLHRSTRSTCT